MKEDILEQIVEDYLHALGYLTMANVKFRPSSGVDGYDSKQDSVHSDVDAVGINPNLEDPQRVVVVSCKSWQTGFDPEAEIRAIKGNKIVSGRERWRAYRELANPKWSTALQDTIYRLTGSRSFTYWTAVTHMIAGRNSKVWTECEEFKKNLTPHLRVVTLQEMILKLSGTLTTTPATSQLGRLLQVMKASGVDLCPTKPSPASPNV
jgi:hypothetical protein